MSDGVVDRDERNDEAGDGDLRRLEPIFIGEARAIDAAANAASATGGVRSAMMPK